NPYPTRQRSRDARQRPVARAFGRRLVAKEKSERRHADQEWRSHERGEGDESFGEADHSSPHPVNSMLVNLRMSRSLPGRVRRQELPKQGASRRRRTAAAKERDRRATVTGRARKQATRVNQRISARLLAGRITHAPPRPVAPARRLLRAPRDRHHGPRRVRVGAVGQRRGFRERGTVSATDLASCESMRVEAKSLRDKMLTYLSEARDASATASYTASECVAALPTLIRALRGTALRLPDP